MALLTADEFRLLHPTELDDASLGLLLDAAESAIEATLGGPVGTSVETFDGGLLHLTLRRRAESITTVVERFYLYGVTATTLATSDYELRNDRRTVRRLPTGTNPAGRWGSSVVVTYEAADDLAERKRVQAALVELDLNYTPGLTSEQIGAWMEQQQKSSVWNYATERASILATLWIVEAFDFA